eukprot:NODE_1660_length_1859_cov_45.541475_g1407_i0.p1 GENE.NODE_1660_length_1859_cov_45.541475_g1407_i0~~NODE_1660_length_1859_cov_45.541475_g1407_i0.p1  ORF type:complete len:542 (-),score=109.78 NODE_1660_length_1859_cov_45.541475_g1407_i0:175-1800(-)
MEASTTNYPTIYPNLDLSSNSYPYQTYSNTSPQPTAPPLAANSESSPLISPMGSPNPNTIDVSSALHESQSVTQPTASVVDTVSTFFFGKRNRRRGTSVINDDTSFPLVKRQPLPTNVYPTPGSAPTSYQIRVCPNVNYNPSDTSGWITLPYQYYSEAEAKIVANHYAVPSWSEESTTCQLCQSTYALFIRRHHCRNCGASICGNCCKNQWPSTMMPPTFHHGAPRKLVRVCDGCHRQVELWRSSLLDGNLSKALTIYDRGNINPHFPLSIFPGNPTSLHLACQGGNLDMVRWLVGTQKVPLRDSHQQPYRWMVPIGQIHTAKQQVQMVAFTAIGIACSNGFIDILRFLAEDCGCSLDEVIEADVLRTGLKAALGLTDRPRPTYEPVRRTSPSPPSRTVPVNTTTTTTTTTTNANSRPLSTMTEEEQLEEAIWRSLHDDSSSTPSLESSTSSNNIAIPVLSPTNPVLSQVSSSPPNAGAPPRLSSNQEDDGSCIICFDAVIDSVLVPCGHCCACLNCSKSMRQCPICRTKVTQVVRMFAVH